MSLMRSVLLAASQNHWLREHAVNYPFVRRTVSRFMPGETLDAALGAAETLAQRNIGSVFTHLGENVTDRPEAQQVTEHYLEFCAASLHAGMNFEISIKLTQLGLDLSPDFCLENVLNASSRGEAGRHRVGRYGSKYLRRLPRWKSTGAH